MTSDEREYIRAALLGRYLAIARATKREISDRDLSHLLREDIDVRLAAYDEHARKGERTVCYILEMAFRQSILSSDVQEEDIQRATRIIQLGR
jgi:hypothetical protein